MTSEHAVQTRLEVPFNRPYVVGSEIGYVREAIESTELSGNGAFSRRGAELLAGVLGTRGGVLLTHSCTGALEMAALLADVGPGDEVIMPSFTFSSTATAFALRGATPVFVDIREDTLNLDEGLVEAAITTRTKALIAVHYAGVACAMDQLSVIAQNHDLMLMEDAAQALGSSYRGSPLATIGALGTLSFHETKNIISGEGGALIVNDPDLLERADILHEKGTNRRAFFRGLVDKYTWVDLGSSFLASEITAAFLCAQLERMEWINAQRMAVWQQYHSGFAGPEEAGLLRRPIVPEDVSHNAHLYYLLLPSESKRDELLDALRQGGIGSVFHYIPLHSSPAGARFGRTVGDMRVTDKASGALLRLPLWVGMQEKDVSYVVDAVCRALG